VGPQGGILGLLNVRKFASEELNAKLSLRCSYIVAFDTLFWDHLRSSAICPTLAIGGQEKACSGMGTCSSQGECLCDSFHAGPACEHSKREVLHNDKFNFQVAMGRYQYFRVHIPPRFPGGYLQVRVQSDGPLILLVRYDDLPTKSAYDSSNFDDWINRRNITTLTFKVDPLGPPSRPRAGVPAFDGPESFGLAGRPPAYGDGMEEQVGLGPRRLQAPFAWEAANASRRLNAASCPALGPKFTHPACFRPSFLHCEDKCVRCLSCVKGEDKAPCSHDCQACLQPKCSQALAACAGDLSCSGPEAQQCEVSCGSCMDCMTSNDGRCGLCNCCTNCLALAAKCMQDGRTETRYLFVGILHHRRHGARPISGSADLMLVEDQAVPDAARSWTADLYNPFQDLRNVEITHTQEYPGGKQFMYSMEIRQEAVAHMQVRVFRDRMTLIHLENVHGLEEMEMSFLQEPEISHILTSSKAAPKTLFDFDAVLTQVDGKVHIRAQQQQDVWCAIFGRRDGYAQVTVKAAGAPAPDRLPAIGVLLLLVMCCAACGGKAWPWSVGKAGPVHEGTTVPLTDPAQGYSGSDVIDRTVEDQYLHRGGLGDEGL